MAEADGRGAVAAEDYDADRERADVREGVASTISKRSLPAGSALRSGPGGEDHVGVAPIDLVLQAGDVAAWNGDGRDRAVERCVDVDRQIERVHGEGTRRKDAYVPLLTAMLPSLREMVMLGKNPPVLA